jgi:beta-lactamase regulating signal transducer with metallopeptidase domain
MSTFTVILQSAFDWTWRTSLQASVLILLVLLLQRLLRRRLTPRLRYALSVLVLCRLLLPVAPSSSFSFENLLAPAARRAQSSPPPTIAAGSTLGSASSVRAQGLAPGSALCFTWFCGLLILGGLAVWRYFHWRLIIRDARKVSDTRLLEILQNVRREVGIRRAVTLASVAQLGSPAVFGVWHFRLLLPETSLKFLSHHEWRLVFLHEMTHIRNYDTVLNSILIVVQFLHWFNPLVWIALHRLRTDRELVCDAMVVERLEPGQRLGYARVLLRLAEAISNGPRAFPSAVPVVSRASEIKTRVTAIKHYRVSGRTLRASIVICGLLLGFLTFTRAHEGDLQTVTGDTARPLSGPQRPEENLITAEFETAGYSLPESVLDDLVQETIQKEFGDRATLTRALQDRGMTFKEFRQQIRERFMAQLSLGGTNVETNQDLSQQKVDAIEIRYVGPKSFKETEIRQRIRVLVGNTYSTAAIDEDVRSLYASGLFYNIRVSTELSTKGVDLVYHLQCNPRIAKIRFAGNSKLSDAQLQKLIRARVGESFYERKIFSDTQAIHKAYEDAGYKGPGVKYSYNLDQQAGEVAVAFEITEQN